jgi:hypothetical protein
MCRGHRTLGKLMVHTKIGISGLEFASSRSPAVAAAASDGTAGIPA